MTKTPVEFNYKGKSYKGHLNEALGAGSNVWHLIIQNYYFGQLVCSPQYGWNFYNNRGEMAELADDFGQQVIRQQALSISTDIE